MSDRFQEMGKALHELDQAEDGSPKQYKPTPEEIKIKETYEEASLRAKDATPENLIRMMKDNNEDAVKISLEATLTHVRGQAYQEELNSRTNYNKVVEATMGVTGSIVNNKLRRRY